MTVIKPSEFPSIMVPSRKPNPRKTNPQKKTEKTNQKNTNRKHKFCKATDPVSFEAEHKPDLHVDESDPVEEHKPVVAAEDQWFLDLLKRTKKPKNRVILAGDVFGMATWLL